MDQTATSPTSEIMTINGGPLFVPDADKSEFIQFRGVLFAIRRRLGLFLIGLTTVLVVGLATIAQLTPTYTARATLQLNTQSTQVVDFDMVLSGLDTQSRLPIVDTEAGILTTNTLARTVVSRLRLMDDPEFNATLREPERKSVWMSALTGFIGNDDGDVEPVNEDDAEEAMLDKVVRAVGARVVSERLPSTFLIDIKFTSESPETATLVANTFAEVYIESQLEDKFEATQRANDWLSTRIGSLGAELEASERQVEAYRDEHGLYAADGTNLVETEIAQVAAQLGAARAQLTEAESRLSAVRSRLALGDGLDTLGEVLNSAIVNTLRRQQSDIVRRRAELESELGPRHPSMVAINRELQDLESRIDEEIQRIVRSLDGDVAIARERVASLEASLETRRGELGESNKALVRLRELERAAEANRVLYDSFLTRFEQTSAGESLQEADAQIISPASVPRHQSFPNEIGFNSLVILLALGTGLGLVALGELFDSGFRTGEDLERATGLTVVGQVPLLSKQESTVDGQALHPIDYVIARPFSVFAESYRTMKAALIRPRAEGGGLMVVFTSGAPGEGKTVNTAAFARTLALSGTKVIVIDGDLRRRQLSEIFGLEPHAGLIEALSGEHPLESVIVEDSSGAHVLPLSPVRYTPQDVFASPAFASVLETLRAHYDVILLDSAPVMAVADTHSLLKLADVTVVMVRWVRSPRRLLRSVLAEMRNVGMKNISLALTQVNAKTNAKHGYGYHDKKYARYYAN